MVEPSGAVDTYLATRYRTGLEQVLLDATGSYVTPAVAGVVEVSSQQIETRRHPDGGRSEGYQGTLTVQGVVYRYRCWVFTDSNGGRFVSDLSEFAPVEWQTSIRVGVATK